MGDVRHGRGETGVRTGLEDQVIEAADLAGDEDERLVAQLRERDAALARQGVLRRQRDSDGLDSDAFDDEVSIRDRKKGKADVDPPLRESL